MTPANQWEIPRRVWLILLSWGLAVLVLAGLLSFWIWSNEREQDRRSAQLQREQDTAMCVMIDVFLSGPEPMPGPEGERSRAVLAAMEAYRATLRCESL